MDTSYRGIFTALATPFDSEGRINQASLCKLIENNIEMGVSGFFVCGSSAEVFTLSLEERKLIMRVVARQVNGRVKLIAHVGCISTDQACELGRYARELGYDAVSSVAPFYHKFGFTEIKKYFLNIADAAELPLIIYNIPAFTGVTFSFEELMELLSDKRIIGIKHTSGDYMLLRQIKTACPDKLIYNGYDETFLCGLVMGADGAIGSNFNFMADKFVKIYELFLDGKIQQAMLLQEKATAIITAIMRFGLSPSIKVILRDQGIDCGVCRAPFKTLSKKDESELLKLVSKIERRDYSAY